MADKWRQITERFAESLFELLTYEYVKWRKMEAFGNADANEIKDVLALANRPFQDAKVGGKVICSNCFKNTGDIKFFLEAFGF